MKRAMNSTKRFLNKKIKEVKEFIEECNEKKLWNLIDTKLNREILLETLQEYKKDLNQFEATLPDNDETDILIGSYEEIYYVGQTHLKTLRRRLIMINEEKETNEQQQDEKERELKRHENDKERDLKRQQDEKERELKRQQDEKERELKRQQDESEKKMKREREEIELEFKREQEEKNRELKREQLEKDREQMEKDRDNKWKLEEIKLQLEMEKIRTEQLRIDADTRTKAIEAEKELKFAERRMDRSDTETRSSGYRENVRLSKLDLMKFDGDIFK